MEKNEDKNNLGREEMKNIKGGINPAEVSLLEPKKKIIDPREAELLEK